jgi:hypothetical protein
MSTNGLVTLATVHNASSRRDMVCRRDVYTLQDLQDSYLHNGRIIGSWTRCTRITKVKPTRQQGQARN